MNKNRDELIDVFCERLVIDGRGTTNESEYVLEDVFCLYRIGSSPGYLIHEKVPERLRGDRDVHRDVVPGVDGSVVIPSGTCCLWPFEHGEAVPEDVVERVKIDVKEGVVVQFSAFTAGKTADRDLLVEPERLHAFFDDGKHGFHRGYP